MAKRNANGQFVGQCANGFHGEVTGDVDPHIEHFDGVSINAIERRRRVEGMGQRQNSGLNDRLLRGRSRDKIFQKVSDMQSTALLATTFRRFRRYLFCCFTVCQYKLSK